MGHGEEALSAVKALQVSIVALEDEVERLHGNCDAVRAHQEELMRIAAVWSAWMGNASASAAATPAAPSLLTSSSSSSMP